MAHLISITNMFSSFISGAYLDGIPLALVLVTSLGVGEIIGLAKKRVWGGK